MPHPAPPTQPRRPSLSRAPKRTTVFDQYECNYGIVSDSDDDSDRPPETWETVVVPHVGEEAERRGIQMVGWKPAENINGRRRYSSTAVLDKQPIRRPGSPSNVALGSGARTANTPSLQRGGLQVAGQQTLLAPQSWGQPGRLGGAQSLNEMVSRRRNTALVGMSSAGSVF